MASQPSFDPQQIKFKSRPLTQGQPKASGAIKVKTGGGVARSNMDQTMTNEPVSPTRSNFNVSFMDQQEVQLKNHQKPSKQQIHNVESNNLEMPQCQVIKSTVGKGYYN